MVDKRYEDRDLEVEVVAVAVGKFRVTMDMVARAMVEAFEEWWLSIDPTLRRELETIHSGPPIVKCVISCLCPAGICINPVNATSTEGDRSEYMCACAGWDN